jgi:hypothetical protein
MASVGITGNGGQVFHCPRCGTVSQTFALGRERHNYVPTLVETCREMLREQQAISVVPNSIEYRIAAAVVPPGGRL